MKIKLNWKGTIVGTAMELCSLLLLFSGGANFKENGLSSLAWVGFILHAPGRLVIRTLNANGLINLVIGIGIPLLIWIGIAHCLLWLLRKKRRDQI